MKLADRKTSCGPHETGSNIRNRGAQRPVIVQLHPEYMRLWLKCCRRELVITYDAVYWHAAKLAADAAKREKKKGRSTT